MAAAPERAVDNELWARYRADPGPVQRDAVILRYVPLVHFVLHRLGLTRALGPDYDDLASAGLVGLIDAVDRFDLAQGTQFSTYAIVRVRGHILDQLRARDWLSRGARRRARELQTAANTLWNELHRQPTEDELARRLSLDLDSVRRSLLDASRVFVSLDSVLETAEDEGSLHERLADDAQVDPSEAAEENDLRARLAQAIRGLPEREQLVLSLYYVETLTLKEIGHVLNISESRVSQLHGRAVLGLRAALAEPAAALAAS